MKELELTLRVRNNLLKERRLQAGLTQGQLAKYSKVPIGQINAMECLRVGHIYPSYVKTLAEYFECSPSDLFPESFELLKRNSILFGKFDVVDIERIKDRIADTKQLDSMEQLIDAAGKKNWVAGQLVRLTPREKQIIELHFGLAGKKSSTREEIASKLNISRERVAQLEAKAIRRIRRQWWRERRSAKFLALPAAPPHGVDMQ